MKIRKVFGILGLVTLTTLGIGAVNKPYEENHDQLYQTGVQFNPLTGERVREETSISTFSMAAAVYTGQRTPGDGEINANDINQYVSERYPEYSFKSRVNTLASDFDYNTQAKTSYYIKNYRVDNMFISEGNCLLNSAYSTIRNLAQHNMLQGIPMGTENIVTSIREDSLFETYSNGPTQFDSERDLNWNWTPNLFSNLNSMPILYSDIRDIAVNDYGYTVVDFSFSNMVKIMNKLLPEYSANNRTQFTKTSSKDKGLESVENNRACILTINGSSTYNDHAVTLVGYSKYEYTSAWWIFQTTKTLYFYEIADNWNARAMYFDPNTSASPSLSFIVLK